jgi:sigma-B regulation protein RsbQ
MPESMPGSMSAIARHHVTVSGRADGQPIVFAHGFGCDQHMWRFVAPEFEATHRVVLFDHVGAGRSDTRAWDAQRYSSLDAYAEDVLDICHELGLADVIFVGHSVSAMIGILAELREPELFARLVLVGPSPRYIDDPPYVGGFSDEDVAGLLESLSDNYLGWSSAMAPVIMGNPDRPAVGEELTESFCRADPEIARVFARATFLSDNRADLARVSTPTLILQCSEDIIAPVAVGEFVRDQVPGSSYRLLRATGHCPNLSAPAETTEAIREFLAVDHVPS